MPGYYRVPTVGTDPRFIAALAALRRREAAMTATWSRPRAYPWIKALHIVAWSPGWRGCSICRGSSSTTPRRRLARTGRETFEVMERRLLRGIMNPALALTIALRGAAGGDAGCCRLAPGLDLGEAGAGAALAVFHHLLARWRRDFAAGRIAACAAVLSSHQRSPDRCADRDRRSCRGQAVLSKNPRNDGTLLLQRRLTCISPLGKGIVRAGHRLFFTLPDIPSHTLPARRILTGPALQQTGEPCPHRDESFHEPPRTQAENPGRTAWHLPRSCRSRTPPRCASRT